MAAEHGMSIMQLAYRFILSHPGVSTVLGGFSSVRQVEEIVGTSADVDPLPQQVLSDLHRIWNQDRA
jgi:aryl-alcohol dehydrogenase-like predicted oxidoreductase